MSIYVRSVASAGAIAAVAAFSVAHAQSVNYNALQDLFGEPVTTSATGAPQRASEAPLNLLIVPQEEIRRSGALTIPSLLSRYSGIDVRQVSRTQTEISVRGYAKQWNNDILVLLNGRQVYMDHNNLVSWESIPVQMGDIRQVEIVQGPATALFGFNATRGVVNILTYDPLDDDNDRIEVRGGLDPDQGGASATFDYKITDGLAVKASGGYERLDPYATDDSQLSLIEGRTAPDAIRWQFSNEWAFRPRPGVRIDATIARSENRRIDNNTNGFYRVGDFDFEQLGLRATIDRGRGGVVAQWYSNLLEEQLPNMANGVFIPGSRNFKNRIHVATASYLNSFGAHQIRAAAEYRTKSLRIVSDDVPPTGAGVLTFDVYSAAGMWNWQVAEGFSTNLAIRVDTLESSRSGPKDVAQVPFENSDYARTITEPSINASAIYEATQRDTFRIALARGVGIPSLFEFGRQNFLPGRVGAGDPNQPASITDSIEASWRRSLEGIGGSVFASVFAQRLRDLSALNVRTVGTGSPSLTLDTTIGDSEMFGVEARLEGRFEKLGWRAEATALRIEDDYVVPESRIAVRPEKTSPELTLVGAARYDFGPVEVDASARYVAPTRQYFVFSGRRLALENVDSFVLGTVRIGAPLVAGARMDLIAQNVLSESERVSGTTKVEREFVARLTKQF